MRPRPVVVAPGAPGGGGLGVRAAVGLVVALVVGACARVGGVEPPVPRHPPPAREGAERGPPGEAAPAPVGVPADTAVPLVVPAVLPEPALPRPWRTFPELEERVAYYVDYFTSRRVEDFTVYLRRMGRYSGFIRERLAAYALPEELVYLPLIESGFSPTAVSRSGAVGVWQFMAGTARRHGLRVTSLVDERRDPIASTDAALAYLSELYQRFGSWFLALAAYNAGENRIEWVLNTRFPGVERSDSLYWAMRPFLPWETQEYVPKFLAAVRIAGAPVRYGFDRADVDDPLAYDVVTVPDATSLDVIADAAGVSQEEIEVLNPHFLRGLTPVGQTTEVRVPAGRGALFALNYARVPADRRVSFVEHRVRGGETLSEIARRYGVRLADLEAANPGVQPRRLQPGQRLIVPRGPVARTRLAARSKAEARVAVLWGPLTHVVRAGETLWEIARRYGVSVAELRRWNGLGEDDVIVAGQELEVREASVLVYRVQPGDTLTAIAARHGLRASDLARFNNMALDAVIRPGDEVRVPVGAP